ncbi:FMN-binding protein [bacterium]|nr:FMN-binding protein [bacterium]
MKNFFSFLFICGVVVGQLYAGQPPYYEQVYNTVDEALDDVFTEGSKVKEVKITISPSTKQRIEDKLGWEIDEDDLIVYKGYKNSKFTGFAIVLDELGKYYPITFLTYITPDYKVGDVVVMVYREKIGASIRKKRFLSQFYDKTSKDSLVIDRDIVGISGATISSWAISNGVKKALVLTEELIKDPIL